MSAAEIAAIDGLQPYWRKLMGQPAGLRPSCAREWHIAPTAIPLCDVPVRFTMPHEPEPPDTVRHMFTCPLSFLVYSLYIRKTERFTASINSAVALYPSGGNCCRGVIHDALWTHRRATRASPGRHA